MSFHVRRQDQQRTDPPRYCDASDAVCSRPDAGLSHADAATFQRDRRSYPEVGTRRPWHRDGRHALNSHGRWLRSTRRSRGNGEENAESGFALVEKVAKAQNFQEIVTLQTRFAQDQMQAYATEMQELQKLMGETLQKLQLALLPDERTTSPQGYEPAFEALPWKEGFQRENRSEGQALKGPLKPKTIGRIILSATSRVLLRTGTLHIAIRAEDAAIPFFGFITKPQSLHL